MYSCVNIISAEVHNQNRETNEMVLINCLVYNESSRAHLGVRIFYILGVAVSGNRRLDAVRLFVTVMVAFFGFRVPAYSHA